MNHRATVVTDFQIKLAVSLAKIGDKVYWCIKYRRLHLLQLPLVT